MAQACNIRVTFNHVFNQSALEVLDIHYTLETDEARTAIRCQTEGWEWAHYTTLVQTCPLFSHTFLALDKKSASFSDHIC